VTKQERQSINLKAMRSSKNNYFLLLEQHGPKHPETLEALQMFTVDRSEYRRLKRYA